MKKVTVLFVVLILIICTSCKKSIKNTSSTDYKNAFDSDTAIIQSEAQESNISSSIENENSTSQSISKTETTSKESVLTENEALAIATDLIKHYETYDNIGIACDLEYNYGISQTDYEAMWNMLSEDQKGYLSGSAYRCKCCKTYEQAKQHLYRCIDSSSINYISEDYVVYKGNLYFFMGAVGSVSYHNIEFKRFENNSFVVYADMYGSGGNYSETYAFNIRKENSGYILKRVEA